jgi:hypothetical protein
VALSYENLIPLLLRPSRQVTLRLTPDLLTLKGDCV